MKNYDKRRLQELAGLLKEDGYDASNDEYEDQSYDPNNMEEVIHIDNGGEMKEVSQQQLMTNCVGEIYDLFKESNFSDFKFKSLSLMDKSVMLLSFRKDIPNVLFMNIAKIIAKFNKLGMEWEDLTDEKHENMIIMIPKGY